jgi:hypothetical protein
MILPDKGKHYEQRREPPRNGKGMTVRRQTMLVTLCPSTCIKQI